MGIAADDIDGQNELLKEIEKISNLGIYETDLINGTWKGSDNFVKIFGLPQKKVFTVEEFQALVHPEDFEEVMAYFNKCLAEQRDFNLEYRCLKPNGDIIYVNSRSRVYYDGDGKPIKIIGIKQDITEQKLYEKRLSELNELNQKKNEVLKLVAHDLRSPVSQIEGIVDLLKKEEENEEVKSKLLDMQEKACKTSKDIISEIIEISELEDRSYQSEMFEMVDLNLLVDDSVQRLYFKANKKGININTSLGSDVFALVDPKKFIRVIDNLLSNAIKFTHKNKSITLSTHNSKKNVVLKVIDKGIGIPKENLPLLFESYSKKTRRQGTQGEQSTGLGLSIVKQIVEIHNGTIAVESKVNQGTTFTIELNRVGSLT